MRTRTLATGSPPPLRRTDCDGFTLLELLVVITLLVVAVGAIAARTGRSLAHRELRNAAGEFAQTARTVREFAVARQRICAIEIDLDRRRYCPAYLSSKGGGDGWRTLQASWLKARAWPEGVIVESYRAPNESGALGGSQILKFYPDGTSSGAAIRLACRQDAYEIVVHPHSGRVVYGDASRVVFAQDQIDLGD